MIFYLQLSAVQRGQSVSNSTSLAAASYISSIQRQSHQFRAFATSVSHTRHPGNQELVARLWGYRVVRNRIAP